MGWSGVEGAELKCCELSGMFIGGWLGAGWGARACSGPSRLRALERAEKAGFAVGTEGQPQSANGAQSARGEL